VSELRIYKQKRSFSSWIYIRYSSVRLVLGPFHNTQRKRRFHSEKGFKCNFEKLSFFYGLVWTEGLTGEIELRFQIPPARCVDGVLKCLTFKISFISCYLRLMLLTMHVSGQDREVV